ncbi:MAG: aminopeptidase P family N-terminal domain-containing protein [Kouleothrix sp.]
MDALALVPGANLLYLAGLDLHMNERFTVAFFPAEGQPAMVLPALEQPRAQAQARFPLRFYPWNDGAGPAAALRWPSPTLGSTARAWGSSTRLCACSSCARSSRLRPSWWPAMPPTCRRRCV